jgi:hypothetical protein
MDEDQGIIEEVRLEVSADQNETERRKKLFAEYVSSPEYQEKLIKRIKINDACYRYPDARKKIYQSLQTFNTVDEMVDSCINFIELFGFTFDPRPQANPHDLPFIMYEFQKETVKWLIEHIENGQDGIIEKSRDMGISWTVFVYVPVWYWLFKDGTNILLGSYKEDLVDNKTKDSLFGMIDYAIMSLPAWLLPRGYDKKKHRTHLKIINPHTYSQITGDTMNADFGRGARKTVVLFDELGSWDYAKDAWEAAGASTACRIGNSTPKGYNYFAMLRDSGIDVLTLHWTKHPLKDQQWYEYEKSRNSAETVAQELDISYNKSQTGRVYPEWNENNVEIGLFPYNPEWNLYVFWDFGNTDDTAIIWAQKNPDNGKLRIIDSYSASGKVIGFYVPFITGMITENGYAYSREELLLITEHKKYRRATHFGDPAGRFKNSVVDQTVFSVLRDNNIIVNFRDEWKEFNHRKNAARTLINRGIELNDNPRTKYLNLCMLNASYPKIKNSGMEQVNSLKPKHDHTSHARSAFEYGALGLKDTANTYRRVYDKFDGRTFNKRKAIGY